MTDQSSSPPNPTSTPAQQVRAMLAAPIPRIFANGIGIQATATDVSLVLLLHDNPAGIVTVAYPVAKAIVVELSKVLNIFETKTGEKIKDINELAALLNK
jgi:hypothetical protein